MRVLGLTVGLTMGCLAGGRAAASDDWPQWRGPDRTGVSTETGLLDRWPEGGPPLVWTATGAGEGYSSLAVADGRLFTMGNRDDSEYVICFDVRDGHETWARRTGRAYANGRGNGPRGTPTVDGKFVYAEGANGDLVCLDAATGEAKWHVNLIRDLGGKNIGWGLSESVLIVDDKLICTPGGRGVSVAALDKHTGKPIWKSGNDPAGYSSPMLGQLDGKPYVVVFTQSTARGVSLDDGEELWQYDRANNGTANVATPIIHDNHVFLSSDYGTGAGLLELTADGDRVHAKEVYFTRDMRNHHCTSVLVDGHLYGFSGQTLNCIVFATGKLKWNKRSVGKGSLVYADGHLYCFSEKGVVGLVEATPQAYREKGRFELARSEWESWAHPVVVGGRLYLRDQDKIRAYDVTAEKVSRIDSPVRPRTYEQLVKGFR